MANYNHEILVNYLRDVYSMELLVRKIEDDIHSTREDIQCEQALVEKVESTPIPAEGNISPKKDIVHDCGFSHTLYLFWLFHLAFHWCDFRDSWYWCFYHSFFLCWFSFF